MSHEIIDPRKFVRKDGDAGDRVFNRFKIKAPPGKARQTITGIHRFTLCDVRSPKALELMKAIQDAIKKGPTKNWRDYQMALRELHYHFGELQIEKKNLVALRGRSAIADRLAGTNTYSGNVNYGAVGTATTAPAAADTQLGAEVYRKAVSSVDVSDVASAIVILSFFFATTDFTNSNINEWGTFIDGAAGANTGRLFSHVLFSETINKTATKTLTVDCQYTVN